MCLLYSTGYKRNNGNFENKVRGRWTRILCDVINKRVASYLPLLLAFLLSVYRISRLGGGGGGAWILLHGRGHEHRYHIVTYTRIYTVYKKWLKIMWILENGLCSARDWERSGLLEENPQSGCSDICASLKGPLIIGLAVETWRVKTELIIITILHIIIILYQS